MKKRISLLLAVVLLLGLSACSASAKLADFVINPMEPLAVGSTAAIQLSYTFDKELEGESLNRVVEALALVYSSDNESVATVDSATGEISAISQGDASITVQAGGISKTLAITVFVPLESIDLGTEETIKLLTEDTYQIEAKPRPTQASVEKISYTSSDESVVAVHSTGEVVAVGAGSATVTAACGEISKAIHFEVSPRIESIAFGNGKNEGLLYIGAQHQLNPVVTPEEISAEYEFVSNDEAVATVDENGMIRAVSAGTCVITASVKGYTNTSVEYNLTVTARPASGGSGSGGSSSAVGQGGSGSGEAPAGSGDNGGETAPPADNGGTGPDQWGNTLCGICGYWHPPDAGHYTCWCGAQHYNDMFHYNPAEPPENVGECPDL